MKYLGFILLFFMALTSLKAQDATLEYFIKSAKAMSPSLLENENLQKINELQTAIINAQNKGLQVNATSEVVFAPYFDNNGKLIDVTTAPSANAFGYDVGISNGGLYAAQLNITKNLFNNAAIDNVLFQNKLQSNSISLNSKAIEHNLIKAITDTYILAYQFQLQEDVTKQILTDLDKRLQVVTLLVKRAVLQQSDYLLLQLDIENKQLELLQLHTNFQITINQLATLSGIPSEGIDKLSIPELPSSEKSNGYYFEKKFENDSLLVEAQKLVFENQYKPKLVAFGNTGLNAVALHDIERKVGMSAGMRLTIPIYDGKQKKYNTQQSELKKESLSYYKQNSETQMDNNLKSLQKQMTALNTAMELLDKHLQKQRAVLEIYKGKLVQGQVSIVDYLNIIQSYKQNVYSSLQMETNKWLLQSQFNFINW